MREIKFRVWNVLNRKFVDFGVGGLRSDYTLNDLFCDNFDDDLSNYKIQQYTGLKDKNGNEIYEGDILRWYKDNNLSEVIFNNGSFFVKGINWTAYWYLGDYNDAYEVIGNIFENPELLES